jgi:hypothetical protein
MPLRLERSYQPFLPRWNQEVDGGVSRTDIPVNRYRLDRIRFVLEDERLPFSKGQQMGHKLPVANVDGRLFRFQFAQIRMNRNRFSPIIVIF